MLEIPTPANQLVSSDVFSDSSTANAAMVGLYSSMYNSNFSVPFKDQITLYASRSADELQSFSNSGTDPFGMNEILVEDANVLGMWSQFYFLIYQANTILERGDVSPAISEGFKAHMKGESSFIRAISHFYLTNFFGDVPVILTTDLAKNGVLPRVQQSEVYNQVIKDLKYAQTVLAADYNYITPTRIRATKWAATALLARVYLYAADYASAEKEASAVISSGLFDMPALQNAFLGTSREAIFRFPTTANGYTYIQQTFAPTPAGFPLYIIRSGLLNAFEAGDQRKDKWVASKLYNNVLYYYPSKYKRSALNRTGPEEYESVLRLAEQYLIRAEARMKQGNIEGARQDLNVVRSRAGLQGTTASDAASLAAAIEQERRVELFAEYGHRWLDLKRLGRANAVLSPLKPTWNANDALYPVPQQARNTNINLTQNAGYPQ